MQAGAAAALGDRKAANVLRTDPDAYASGNPGCLVQVTAALRRAGRPTRHVDTSRSLWAEPLCGCAPVELLDAREQERRCDREEAVRIAYVQSAERLRPAQPLLTRDRAVVELAHVNRDRAD